MFINRNTAHWSHSADLFIYFYLTHITHWSVSLEWRHNSIVQHNIFTWFVRIWCVRIRTQDNSQLITTLGHYIADNCRLWHASVRINRIKMCKCGKRAWNRLWKRFDYECLLLFFLFKHLTLNSACCHSFLSFFNTALNLELLYFHLHSNILVFAIEKKASQARVLNIQRGREWAASRPSLRFPLAACVNNTNKFTRDTCLHP